VCEKEYEMSVPVLRPFQLDAVERVAQAARAGHKVIVLQSATGSGKSTMSCDIVRRAVSKGSRVLFIVHRRRLVDQFSDRLIDFQIDHGVLMRGHKMQKDCRVQVASRDTLISRVMRNEYMPPPPSDLVIVDEGRHAAAPEFRKLLEPFKDNRIILLDATPVMPDGRGLGPWATAIVCAAPVSQLIRDGYLVPVKCFAPDRKKEKGRKRRGIAGDLVDSWKEFAQGMPTVSFFGRVQHSREAVDSYNAAGIPAAHVDADTPDDVRDEIFDRLNSGSLKVVGNVGIIKEGVDVPCLGCCQIYMDPPGRVGFLQAAGRVMRPFPGKAAAVLIDHAGAVFRHGFPDEDTEWTLEGNADEAFKKQHDEGQTAAAFYCSRCQLVYHGDKACPQCGRAPVKPPRSIFAPPPMEPSDEMLVEAERTGGVWSEEQKIKHWLRCVAVAANRNGSFGMARVLFQKKYGEWPGEEYPCNCNRWKMKVEEVYPDFKRKKAQV
jgi:DNA repair protein RadD